MKQMVVAVALALVGLLVLPVAPAQAAARVNVDGGGQGAVIDGTYSTQLRVSGAGFQSIRGGHGGIYVWFGTVSPGWRPSQGGVSGVDYLYVPDREDKSNQGFQQYVAFPGSDTGSSAAASMSATGSWSVRLTVPGPTFQAVGRNGAVRTVDCRKTTCGVITVGAHGVRNANNETFTPVRVGDLHQDSPPPVTGDAPGTGSESLPEQGNTGSTATAATPTGNPRPKGPVRLSVDRTSAGPGKVLSWTAANLAPGRQFTVVVDDGVAAGGPFSAGPDGRAAGVVPLPVDLRAGTHELRLFGAGRKASVKFGTAAAEDAAAGDAEEATAAEAVPDSDREPVEVAPLAFAGVGAAAFLVALVVALGRLRGWRRA